MAARAIRCDALERGTSSMNKPFSPNDFLADENAGQALRSAGRAKGTCRPVGLLVQDVPLLRPPHQERRKAIDVVRRPTARECRPWRPRPKPRWSPSGHRAPVAAKKQLKGRVQLELRSADDLGQVRKNFRYSNYGTTSADFCDKSGRQFFGEGPHEAAWKRWFRVNPNCTDVQFQPTEAIFTDEHGYERRAIWDVAIEILGRDLFFGEIKADRSFFGTRDIKLIGRLSTSALRREGIDFVRLHGCDFDDITLETIKYVFDRRRAAFHVESEANPLIHYIGQQGGVIDLRQAASFLGGSYYAAEAKICAMMNARLIAIDLAFPLCPASPVRQAPEAQGTGALRRFLERFRND